MEFLKYTDIIKLNRELKKTATGKPFKVVVLSNIMVHYIKEVLEYTLFRQGLTPSVSLGDYDNILQNATDGTVEDAETVLIFWELANLLDGFHYKIETLSDDTIVALTDKIKGEISWTFKNLATKPMVIFNSFSSSVFNGYQLKINKLDQMAAELNNFVAAEKPANVQLVDLEKVFSQISIPVSVNFRDYYSSKSLYTVPFFQTYSEQIAPLILSAKGKAKKALIFDCDNTLWQGIIGEDGLDGIKMSAQNKATAYEEVQYLAKTLVAKGVIIGLCSKNNFADVEQVIEKHPDFRLTNDEIVIKSVNWQDKASNLKAIAEDLNIGLDSFVFVDDSDFEVNLIREQLPQVEVIQVPTKALYTYPDLIRRAFRHFFNLSETSEDLVKNQMYKKEMARKEEAHRFDNIEDYLKSLDLTLTVHVNDVSIVARMAQMTQKTNQFNLTTQRYTEQDILNFITNGASVVAFSVQDRFGDSGITGLAILTYENETATIDTLLMSCRILGRNVEYKFFDTLIAIACSQKAKQIEASYLKTMKNDQVKDFYDRLGFKILRGVGADKFYSIAAETYQTKALDYIKLIEK